jgi:endonuclease/exonuclease/phosphatase family metal-dependent hydrolase
MTRNLYLGASMGDAIAAPDPDRLADAADRILAQVRDNCFPERAEGIAAEVAAHQPDLVGLQEVALWRCGPTGAPGTPGGDATGARVDVDYLRVLLDALAARGLSYAPVPNGVVTNFDVAAPQRVTSPAEDPQDLRLTDRDVLLVRTDVPSDRLSVAEAQAANFDTSLTLPAPGAATATVTVPRGFVCVDATVHGRPVRVVTTHLDPIEPAINLTQAEALLDGPADTTGPVVLLGDFNTVVGTGSGTGSHDRLLEAGFTDAWSQARPDRPGLTCCAPEDLGRSAPGSGPGYDRRIDLVLFRGPGVRVEAVDLVGTDPADRTPSGLWPSDHAGVVAALSLA